MLSRTPGGDPGIDKKLCQWFYGGKCWISRSSTIRRPPPSRSTRSKSRLLAELAEPASAAALAGRLGIPRQKINYHLRSLEEFGLIRVSEERLWGGLRERVMVASAASYMVSPAALGPVAADPARGADRLSASYLIALAARIVREVSGLVRRAREADKRLATLSIDTEITFKSAADRAAFTRELTGAVTRLVGRYHDSTTAGGRAHRLVIVSHPLPQDSARKE